MATTWIPILVRSDDYAEVAAWIADRERDRNDGTAWSDIRVTIPAGVGATASDEEAFTRREDEVAAKIKQRFRSWDVELLTRFAKSTGVETVDRWKLVMDLACGITGNAGTFYSTQDVAAETGMTVDQWRSACRALTRHLKAHYPPGTDWPLAGASGKDFGVYNQLYVYATPETAARWKQARELAN